VSARPSDLAAALVDSLDDAALDELAAKLAPRLAARLGPGGDEWLDTKGAVAYLNMSSQHALQRAKQHGLPYYQDVPGGKCSFKRSELDEWRAGNREGRSS
jgi:hypothetical protein